MDPQQKPTQNAKPQPGILEKLGILKFDLSQFWEDCTPGGALASVFCNEAIILWLIKLTPLNLNKKEISPGN